MPQWIRDHALLILTAFATFLGGLYTGVVTFAFLEQQRRTALAEEMETHRLWHATELDRYVIDNCDRIKDVYVRDGLGRVVAGYCGDLVVE